MITKAKIKPRYGYKIKEDADGVQYYLPIIDRRIKFENNVVNFRESGVFTVPKSKLNRFKVILVGGGGCSLNKVNGSAGDVRAFFLTLKEGEQIHVSVGNAGSNGSAGGSTSFGIYGIANGGSAGTGSETSGYEYLNEEFGSGANSNSPAKGGMCIIMYDDYINIDPIYPNPDDMVEESNDENIV